jgi:hypothetical protein
VPGGLAESLSTSPIQAAALIVSAAARRILEIIMFSGSLSGVDDEGD